MIELRVHLHLFGHHHRTVFVSGVFWRYCSHRSHRWHLKCWRWDWWDGYCGKHNGDCWGDCPTED